MSTRTDYDDPAQDKHWEPTVVIEHVLCDAETPLAIHVMWGEEHVAWLPKRLVDDDSEVYEKGNEGRLVIPEWLAIEKGMV